MTSRSRLRRYSLIGIIVLVALTVLYGSAGADIGFRRVTPLDRILDPVRHPARLGYASAIWDTTAQDTAVALLDSTTLDTTALSPDSLQSDTTTTLSPDSTQLSNDTLGTGLPLPTTGATLPSATSEPDTLVTRKLLSPSDEKASGTSGAQDETEEEPKREEKPLEPAPHHPTNVYSVELPVETKSELDPETGLIKISHKWAGQDMGTGGSLPYEAYLARQVAVSDRTSWRTSVLAKFPSGAKKEAEGINIQIPVFKSQLAQQIFGGKNIGLSVTGNIQIDGSLTSEKKNELQAGGGSPSNYAFKINQKQQFNIKGNVGEKVSVEIDQDSEKLFEFENNLKVRYKGNEDEIIQSIEAGNVDLSLRGSKLATASSQHKGLFGFKTEAKLGGWKLTTIASLDKGEKNTQKWSGGRNSDAPHTISPVNFVQGRYFFLDSTYRENYRYYDKDFKHVITPLAVEIDNLEVYKSVRNVAGSSDNAVPGWAFADPNEYFNNPDSIPSDQEHTRGSFIRLEPNSDYQVDKYLGWIRLSRSLDAEEILAVAYSTVNSDTIGDLDPQDNDETTNPFILKLIQPKNPQPVQTKTWNLMWRHVYDLGATGISEEGFEFRIIRTEGQTGQGKDSGPDKSGRTRPYLSIFGLDQFSLGGKAEDGKVDAMFIDYQQGELHFPDLTPFDPKGWFEYDSYTRRDTLVPPSLAEGDAIPELYTKSTRENQDLATPPFNLTVRYSNESATKDLGFGVLEGSEEVLLGGRRLTKGVDYSIDYMSGSLTIMNKSALAPGADLEIRYEKGQVFQLDTQTKLGLRVEYELWENSYIGGTLLYLNQRTMEQRVRVGGEPKRNTVWAINGALNYEPELFTRAVDFLPFIETDAKSQFRLEGEIAQVFPDPNPLDNSATGDNNGVAYVDDFESIKRSTPLGVTRRQWSAASFPLFDSRGEGRWLKQRGRTIWYNPDQIKVKDIWPERQTDATGSTVQVLRIDFQPWWTEWGLGQPPEVVPEKSWGGVMRYLGPGYSDQSQSKYIEVWLNPMAVTQGTIYFDLGRISEDVIPGGGRSGLNTEDTPRPGYSTGDGVVDDLEDTGIDGVTGVDPADFCFVNGEEYPPLPSYDDWDPNPAQGNKYHEINGTENNGTRTPSDEGGRIPDTEDLSGNGFLDQTNDFYRYRLDLSERDANRYIVGGQGNEKGWRLYRIPLTDTLMVGKPAFTDLDYVRIWFTGFRGRSGIMIAQMEIVGNEWREVKSSATRNAKNDPVSVAVVNTHDNPAYSQRQPPGVAGEVDPVSGLREKEQSLVIRVNRLGTGETGSVYKTVRPSMDLIEYKRLKMFVRGGGESGRLIDRYGRPLDLEMFLRFGADFGKDSLSARSRYYEYSQRLAPSWAESNEINIELDRLAALKFLREQDSTRDYDILPDGDVIRAVGNASLRDISFIQIGLKNHGAEITPEDGVEIWVDEMRVSDIQKTPGWAATGSVDLKFANLLDLHADLRQDQADFHSLDSRRGADPADKLGGNFSAGIELGEFFDPELGLKLPIDFRFKQDISIPKYKPNSDVKLTSLSSEKISLWSNFNDALFTADRFRRDPHLDGPTDSLISTDKQYTVSTNISKGRKSEFWPIRYTVDNIRLGGSYQESWGRDYSYLLEYRKAKSANAAYTLAPEKPVSLKWLGWAENVPVLNGLSESVFRPLPSSVNLSGTGSEATSTTVRRSGTNDLRYQFTVGRTAGVGWRPFDITSFDFSQTINSIRIPEDSVRSDKASRLSRMDVADYWIITDGDTTIDRERWKADSLAELGSIKDKLFWKGVGYYFVDTDISQSLNTNFNPNVLSWLGTDFSYRTNYRWNWGQNLGPTERSVRARGDFSSTVTLKLTQLTAGWGRAKVGDDLLGGKAPMPFGDVSPGDFPDMGEKNLYGVGSNKPMGSSGGSTSSGSGSSGSLSKPKAEGGSTTETSGVDQLDSLNAGEPTVLADSLATDTTKQKEKESVLRRLGPSPLVLAKGFISRVQDIQWGYTLSGDVSNYYVAEGQASWPYRLGFTRNPNLPTIPGYANRDNYNRREEHKFSSGYRITDNLQVSSLEFTTSKSRNIAQKSESGTNEMTVYQYFGDDGLSIKQVPAANWSIRWGGWEKLPYISDWATSISLENSFRGSQREQWSRGQQDSARKVTGIEYEKNYSPLLGINFTWKNGIGTTARYGWTRRVNDERQGLGAKRRTTNATISVSGSYTAKSGFTIPIPVWPFKNRRFKNNTTFSVRFESGNNRTESSAHGAPFSASAWSSSWSFTPSMDYSFSTAVRGGFHYTYSVQKSQLTSSRSQEAGFTVNISIRG